MAFMNARKRNKTMTYILVAFISIGLLASVSVYWSSGSYSVPPAGNTGSSETQAVQDFNDGSALLGQQGKEKEAEAKLNSAIKGFEQIIQSNPKNLPVLGDLATAYFYLGNTDKAIQLANQALSIDPNYNIVRLNLARYQFFGKNNKDAAVTELKKIPKNDYYYKDAQDLLNEVNGAPQAQNLPPQQGSNLPPQGQTLPPKN